jgi:hypothetical protein
MTNVMGAVKAGYMLGRAGCPARQGMFDRLIRRASEGDDGGVARNSCAQA